LSQQNPEAELHVKPEKLIREARANGQTTLNEADSKRLLAPFGIPVVEERVAADAEQAVRLAEAIGYPVAIKGLGASLSHKTERGLVRLNVVDRSAIEAATAAMTATAGDDLEGFLVQPMVSGRRELVAGLFRDRDFGPVVMLGLGGIFTEALDDVVLRLAPIEEAEAAVMLSSLDSSSLLGPFRGESAADREALIQTLVGLSRLGTAHDEVVEVDINPLVVSPDGRVTAVDALVVLGEAPEAPTLRPPVGPAEMGALFHPRSVAFVGASAEFGKWGNTMFSSVVAGGFEGGIHLVNPKGGTIAGRPVYRSVTEIPDPVDLAVVTIPAHRVQSLLPELEEKGITGVVLITSGFAEVGERGRELEQEVVADARSRGILILGPNTMGISNPHRSFYCTGAVSYPKPGPTAFFSQSGNMGVQLLGFAEQQAIGIRAFAGTGNEAMLTIEDALDGFAVDPPTRTLLLYVESIKNGRRFFSSAREVSRQKPVILLKGGRTEAGGKAAASHTGALATNERIFEAACHQAGVVLADRPMDMLDLSAAFSSLPLPAGNRVAIMTLGGGWGVVTADLCDTYGLEVPTLSNEIVERIDRILPDYWSRANPVDMVGDKGLDMPFEILEALIGWDGCDAVIHLGIIGRKHLLQQNIDAHHRSDPTADSAVYPELESLAEDIEKRYIRRVIELMEIHRKPVVGVSLVKGPGDDTVVESDEFAHKGVFFGAPEQAVKSLSRMCRYREWRMREGLE
jgi:acyl-CoA synthetase (NDP forming)